MLHGLYYGLAIHGEGFRLADHGRLVGVRIPEVGAFHNAVCECVCVCERETEREREGEKKRERERERERECV